MFLLLIYTEVCAGHVGVGGKEGEKSSVIKNFNIYQKYAGDSSHFAHAHTHTPLHLVQVSIKILLDILFCNISSQQGDMHLAKNKGKQKGKGLTGERATVQFTGNLRDHHAADPLKEKLSFPQLLKMNLQVFKLYYAQV